MTREAYEKPQIIRHEAALGNRFGNGPGRRVMDAIEGIPVEKLIADHGSPLFVFSERELRRKAREMREAFRSRYPRTTFAWSYKTNHLDAICGLFHQEGWTAEVVSAAEYAMARRLGVPGRDIVFNGAYKPASACRIAAADSALVQIDHFDELTLLETIAAERGTPLAVGIRVNMTVETLGITWDRFGFNLESGEALEAARRIADAEQLELVGLHCHLGTYIAQPAAYREAAQRLAALAREIEAKTGARIDVINLGGGFPSRSALYSHYGTAEDTTPPIDEFAKAIADELNSAFEDRAQPPRLILESGGALVDEGGTLLATVVGTRRLPDGWRGLVLDAGVNLLYIATWYRHDVIAAQEVSGQLEDTTLYGPLCMAIDVVRRRVLLPPLESGHRVAIRPVGAYNVTQWMQFSQMRPAVVMVCEDGAVEVIRRAESIDDLKSIERLPARFAPTFGDATPEPAPESARATRRPSTARTPTARR